MLYKPGQAAGRLAGHAVRGYTAPMNQDDSHNQVIPEITPGALLEVMENPDAFSEIARADLYVQMAKMREIARSHDIPTTQRMDYMKFLAKMGRVENPGGQDNPLAGVPGINIIFSSNPGKSVQITAERDITPDQDVDHGFGSGNGKQSKAVLP